VLGFDGSISNDATALIGCTVDEVRTVRGRDVRSRAWRFTVDPRDVRCDSGACTRQVRAVGPTCSGYRDTLALAEDGVNVPMPTGQPARAAGNDRVV
jgi:hypothetical protein